MYFIGLVFVYVQYKKIRSVILLKSEVILQLIFNNNGFFF